MMASCTYAKPDHVFPCISNVGSLNVRLVLDALFMLKGYFMIFVMSLLSTVADVHFSGVCAWPYIHGEHFDNVVSNVDNNSAFPQLIRSDAFALDMGRFSMLRALKASRMPF